MQLCVCAIHSDTHGSVYPDMPSPDKQNISQLRIKHYTDFFLEYPEIRIKKGVKLIYYSRHLSLLQTFYDENNFHVKENPSKNCYFFVNVRINRRLI